MRQKSFLTGKPLKLFEKQMKSLRGEDEMDEEDEVRLLPPLSPFHSIKGTVFEGVC